MLLNTWGEVLTLSFQNLWVGVVSFVPNLVVAALDVLVLSQVNLFLQDVVLGYLPRVLAAVLVLLVAGVIGDVTGRVVVTAARTAGIDSAHFVGAIAQWAIWIFAILVALSQLGIAT